MSIKYKKIIFSLIIIMIILTGILSTSFALFKKEKLGARFDIVVGELKYELSSPDLTNNVITVSPLDDKFITIDLKSLNDIETEYQLVYTITNGLNNSSLNKVYYTSYKSSSKGTIGVNETKQIEIVIENNSQNNYNVKFKVLGGFKGKKVVKTNEIEIDQGTYEVCNIPKGTVYNFGYTGNEQRFTAPCTGTYKLEVWGAQGGNRNAYIGGYGSYSIGNFSTKKDNLLYINVGGAGSNTTVGGYNGGGRLRDGQQVVGSSGGGATHIANKSGLLSTLSSFKDTVLIVSGGGGGATNRGEGYGDGNGGSAGGIVGNNGQSINATNGYGHGYGTGGNQTTGGVVVWIPGTAVVDSSWTTIGGFGTANGNSALPQSGGGSGWYGGGAGAHGGGGGGSSYVGNSLLTNKAMYCYNCQTSNEESTKTISNTCVSSSPTVNCSKSGNGYAKITYLGK